MWPIRNHTHTTPCVDTNTQICFFSALPSDRPFGRLVLFDMAAYSIVQTMLILLGGESQKIAYRFMRGNGSFPTTFPEFRCAFPTEVVI